MIPKIIHYCWFGTKKKSELERKCIDSWKKYCPNYEIKEWNETNFDINICPYVKEAYNAKKWAFVSDYARFWILYNYGGLYFDTDVELINRIDDLIETGSFMGCERNIVNKDKKDEHNEANPAPGLGLAAEPGLGLYKEILDFYDNKHFVDGSGNLDITTVVMITTNIIKKHGWKDTDSIQKIDDIFFYPPEYFCPMDYNTGIVTITENTRSIHHYSASWKTDSEKHLKEKERLFRKRFGYKFGYQLFRLYGFVYRRIKHLRCGFNN